MSSTAELNRIETQVPARMDRLPWSRFHWRVVFGLGLVWILDGLEVTMVGNVAARLTEDGSGIDISAGQIGLAAAIYIVGATLGALFFGQLTDRWGRKKLFLITLAVYIVATVATAFATTPLFFYVTRFFTGAGIGGEYAAINSAIDELIPARVRGRVDLTINGSYWLGSAAGSALALVLLNTSIFAADLGWRLAFGLGAVLGLTILVVRRHVPESPRWLFIHGQEDEAERIVGDIEDDVREETGQELEDPEDTLVIRQRKTIPFREIAKVAFTKYPKRAVLGLALFIGQAFIYNGVTFNLGTLLNGFYDVSSGMVPLFVIVWALANFAGPVTLGRLFDTVGRKPMIAGTYLGSAVVVTVLGLYLTGTEGNRWIFLAILAAAFYLASSGASAAYLTVSEIFPMETRALAIAFFYAVGTAVGGITGPLLFGRLIESGDRGLVALAFYIGAGVMAIGGLIELVFGVKAEKSDLESLAAPLTSDEDTDSDEEAEGEKSQGKEPGGKEAEGDEDREDPRAVERRQRDARIRERRARQVAGSTGSRRYRPGPGQGVGSPWIPPAPSEPSERALDSEIELITAAMQEHDEMAVADLADAVNAKFWGPGRFPRALRVAADEGRVVRVSRGRVRAPDRVAAH